MTNFQDNFSGHSNTYQKYRPTYPEALFSYLTSLTGGHQLAWDCGTGNGQAAVSLASHYDRVYATDPSEGQIFHAIRHPKVTYQVEKAEDCSLEPQSVDLVTVAQALHWFDFPSFYEQVRRVLKPSGLLAAWIYKLPEISTEIDEIIHHFHYVTVDDFWQAGNRMVEQHYKTIPFPFEELPDPGFEITTIWNLHDLLGLIESWSALQRYKKHHGTDPLVHLKMDLEAVWGSPQTTKKITWPLTLKTGRIPVG